MKGQKKYRSISIYRTYTIKELAKILNVNVRAVYKYCKNGLKPIEKHSSFLFFGKDVREFLKGRLQRRKVKLNDNEMFCLKCKKGVVAKNTTVENTEKKTGQYDLYIKKGLCPICNSKVSRFWCNKVENIENELQTVTCENI